MAAAVAAAKAVVAVKAVVAMVAAAKVWWECGEE